MLFYGNKDNIIIDGNCRVVNFSSLVEGFPDAKLLPPNNLGAVNEYDFDVKYMHYIMDININFINFMNIIMELYYNNNDIYLIISEDDWSSILIDSLLKLIQQRYGINGILINSYEDYIYEKVYNTSISEFDSGYGIPNLMIDKERYIYLYELMRAKNGEGGNIEQL